MPGPRNRDSEARCINPMTREGPHTIEIHAGPQELGPTSRDASGLPVSITVNLASSHFYGFVFHSRGTRLFWD